MGHRYLLSSLSWLNGKKEMSSKPRIMSGTRISEALQGITTDWEKDNKYKTRNDVDVQM